ncbi:sulfur carrier protein ThiS [Exiguobacterium sp. s193]|uniref:sulfur carrier protein ThiS n=1 Tax=Exiguobacterium sp. s193 TaxID=2751207 RepID=UPI001BE7B905|nr:sulfur carrier protein ThiS [Exiguobacterium sp. s193]
MELTINGQAYSIDPSITTLDGLIKHLNLSEKLVIIEQNRQIIERTAYQDTPIQIGDSFEIVHFVGGG